MSKKRHNFFRLCSLVLAFMLTFTNMPAVAYATDGYSTKALVEDTAEASESDAITEDGEIEESEPAVSDDELPAEDAAEDAGGEGELDGDMELLDVEEIDDDSKLMATDQWTVTFFNGADQIDYVNVYNNEYVSRIPTISKIAGKVFDGWMDGTNPATAKHFTNEELAAFPITQNMNLYASVQDELPNLEFTDSAVEEYYGEQVSNALKNTLPANTVVEYTSSDPEIASVDDDGKITAVATTGTSPVTITASVYAKYTPAIVGGQDKGTEPLGTATCSLTVEPRPLVLRPVDKNTDVYDGTEKTSDLGVEPVALQTYGLLKDHEVTATVEGKGTNAGAYDLTIKAGTVKVTVTDSTTTPATVTDVTAYYAPDITAKGTLTINPAPVTLTWDEDISFNYDGDKHIPTATSVVGTEATNVEYKAYSNSTCTTLVENPKDVGTYYVKATLKEGASNYTVTPQTTSYKIVPVDTLYITADDYSVVYDGAAHSPVVEVFTDSAKTTKAVAGTYKVWYSSSETGTYTQTVPEYTAVNKDGYKVYIKVTRDNYIDATATQTITINNKTLYVVATGYVGDYDENEHVPVVEVFEDEAHNIPATAGTYTVKYSTDGGQTWKADAPTFKAPTTAEQTVNIKVSKTNYDDAEATATFNISKLTLVLEEIEGIDIDYDEADHSLAVPKVYKDAAKTLEVSGATLKWKVDNKDAVTTAPVFNAPGTHTVKIWAEKENYDTSDELTVTVTINELKLYIDATSVTADWVKDTKQSITVVNVYKDAEKTTTVADYVLKYSTDGVTYSTTNPQYEEPGVYTVYIKAEKTNYTDSDPATPTITINKLSQNLTVSLDTPSWDYNATAGVVTATADFENPTITKRYKKQSDPDVDASYSATMPTNAGSYTVRVDAAETAHYKAVTKYLTFSINKISWSSETEAAYKLPTGKAGLVFSGSAQGLLDVSQALPTGLYRYYRVAISGSDDPQPSQYNDKSIYTDKVPTGTNAGKYRVFYYILGDDNHVEYPISKLCDVEIAKADIDVKDLFASVEGWTFGDATIGTPELNKQPGVGTVAFYYSTGWDEINEKWKDEKAWTGNMTNMCKPGTYHVYAKITGVENYNDGITGAGEFTIAKKPVRISVNVAQEYASFDYTGTAVPNTAFSITLTSADQVTGQALPDNWTATGYTIKKAGSVVESAKDAGTYTISITDINNKDANDYYVTSSDKWSTGTVVINKRNESAYKHVYDSIPYSTSLVAVSDFTLHENWSYDASSYTLVTGDPTTNSQYDHFIYSGSGDNAYIGELHYSTDYTEGSTTATWKTRTELTATAAGDYDVYCKVVWNDSNLNDTYPQLVSGKPAGYIGRVTVSKATAVITDDPEVYPYATQQ